MANQRNSKLKRSHSVIETLFAGLLTSLERRSTGSLFADGRPVIIYGAGNVGKDVFRLLAIRGITVTAFLDRGAKPESSWEGVPILTPDDPALSPTQRQQAHLIIGIFNAFVEVPAVLVFLRNLGYGQITTFLELHDRYPSELGDRFWLTARSFYRELQPQITAGFGLLSDEASRDLYARILKFRLSMDHEALPAPDQGNQYFVKDLPPWPSPLRFVDCGAFDGDTLRQLSSLETPVEAIAAFEPDLANFVKLAHHVRSGATKMPPEVCLFPCGVGSSASQVRFSSGHGTGSHASAAGDTVIQCVSLDEALPFFRPNLIKMDIEGAEYDALRGARHLISEHRPALAICLYHRPEHLWQIPLLVRQLTDGGGKYFLRSHCFDGFELVLYWFPD